MNTINSAKKFKSKIAVNIDTVKLKLEGMLFDIPGASVATLNDCNGKQLNSYGNRVPIKGNYGAHNMHVRTMNSGQELILEGSPFAFRYGQNVYTSSDLLRGCRLVIKRGMEEFDIKPSDSLLEKWREGDITLERVDLAVNFKLDSESEVKDVLKQTGRQLLEHGSPMGSYGSTVYFIPRKGKEYSICFYAKGQELRQAQKYVDLPSNDRLVKECENILRVEVRLRASELLELGLDKASAWDCDTPEKVFLQYMAKLKLLNVTSGPFNVRDLEDVPARLKPVMALHKSGVDLKRVYSERTCRRHNQFFSGRGIDLRCPNQPVESITSLREYLSPEKVINSPPEWMQAQGLVPPPVGRKAASRKGQGVRSGREVNKIVPVVHMPNFLELFPMVRPIFNRAEELDFVPLRADKN